MENFNSLPIEIKWYIFSFLIKCKFNNKILLNKEFYEYANKIFYDHKYINLLNRKICSKCWDKEIKQLKFMFYYL